MAAVFHFNPSYGGAQRKARRAASDRLPALLRGMPREQPYAVPTRFRVPAQTAESWPSLEYWVRRLLWLAITVVIAVDLTATFVLQIR
jgi:hypothetical protein